MPYIPDSVAETELSQKLSRYLGAPRMGKVRDTYYLGNNLMLFVATDRISIFDFVLGRTVPRKGEVLTAETVFWMILFGRYFTNHIVDFGSKIDRHLPVELRRDTDLQKRALVARRLHMVPVEYIVRDYLTGTGLTSYEKNGEVCGHKLPPGLHDGSKLPEPLFTPTTKAEIGHDEHISATYVAKRYGMRPIEMSFDLFGRASRYAAERGLIIADTKFEFGALGNTLAQVLGDEVLTSDSSRFWRKVDWEKAQKEKKSPSGYDKELVRQWGKPLGIHKLEAESEEVQIEVGKIPVPDDIVDETSVRYEECLKMIADVDLAEFQGDRMRIK